MKRLLLLALCLTAGCMKDASSPTPQAIDQAAAIKPLTVVMPEDAGAAAATAEPLPSPKEEEKQRHTPPKPQRRTVTEEDLQKFIVWRRTTDELTAVAQKEFQARTNAIRK